MQGIFVQHRMLYTSQYNVVQLCSVVVYKYRQELPHKITVFKKSRHHDLSLPHLPSLSFWLRYHRNNIVPAPIGKTITRGQKWDVVQSCAELCFEILLSKELLYENVQWPSFRLHFENMAGQKVTMSLNTEWLLNALSRGLPTVDHASCYNVAY